MKRTTKVGLIAMLLSSLLSCAIAGAQSLQDKSAETKMRVGTFDSRSVAIAYARSAAFGREVVSVKREYDQAKSSGDEKHAAELDARMSALQDLMHKQAFGTYSVANILEKIKGRIPEIAAQANVDVIVSKWDVAYQRPGIDFTDVTDLMVKPFEPDEKTLEILKEVTKQSPVPLEELNKHKD